MEYKIINFTKESCGPCGLVKKYFKNVKDERINLIEEVDLDDFSGVPIPPENLELAKQYDITATPVLVVIDGDGNLIEKFTGGLPITQNIKKLLEKYLPHIPKDND